MANQDDDLSQFIFPNHQPVVQLECKQAFDGLTDKERAYAHYLSVASWYGGLIVLVQTSPESPLIFTLLNKLYRNQPLAELKELALTKCGFTEDDFTGLLVYSSGIYTNMGNYKGFGDSKFIPNVSKDKVRALIKASQSYEKDGSAVERLWNLCSEAMYSLGSKQKQLAMEDRGITTYFSANCTNADADLIKRFLQEKGMEAYNTRLFRKDSGGDAKNHYEVRLASSYSNEDPADIDVALGKHTFDGATVEVTRGDYQKLLAFVVDNLEKAQKYVANETENKMLGEYIKSFSTGSLPAHKDGSRYWIQNKGPVIETYIGFIETYRDPTGQRGEFEGFVAMVNKQMSAKFGELVDKAVSFLPLLPWPSSFEKDKFLRPDFTSLDVLTFAGSGIPAGINIPNYDEIRQDEGFKNVSLGNVIPASYKDAVTPFLIQSDQDFVVKYRVESFEVQVGLHELLGHGSGKLLCKDKDGKLNFDESLLNPETGAKIETYYQPGETYDSIFTTLGSAYEECRAECVGLHLSLIPEIVKIFSHEGEKAADIVYVNWLTMAWAGLRGLEMYQPEHSQWGQAHSQARFVILQVLLEAGADFVQIKECTGTDGKPDLLLTLDRSKIETVGKPAISNFLKKLQVFKATADIKRATAMFSKYSHVAGPGEEGSLPFLTYRSVVVARKQPRKMMVQNNTVIRGSYPDQKVELIGYEASHEGLITSWVERFLNTNIDEILEQEFEKTKSYFTV